MFGPGCGKKWGIGVVGRLGEVKTNARVGGCWLSIVVCRCVGSVVALCRSLCRCTYSIRVLSVWTTTLWGVPISLSAITH
jgi:hypothetical protein